MLYCNVSVRHVTYQYTSTNSTFQTIAWSLTPTEEARLLAVYVDQSGYLDTRLPPRIEGSGLRNGSLPYTVAFELEASRQLMSYAASIYGTGAVESIQATRETIGSRIRIVPLILYVVSALGYRFVFLFTSSVHDAG